ncbi:hypothetical protein M758_10G054500 [Ceratodon purpureus]|uniref:Ethylene receptor n=1 Tax=Ceratodon purpureus TaxID=3225 RepID=A0A8T0GHK7_CERPU|nr:hypothetical protein KC19_10G058200 [Ceratodon purpureus]KAG0558832.1 hypothetical protein KC19_10G058200 [Ceratodon purpureus]KAG0602957.1 hypothetical protein M758_10G054500 [Ceratodon purpureus]KAG0602958.1 hypothetical protein M758_10G054500 [Ceratodon purpureus]KAG0602961.1 hypothetical protein M758_10G054500 [Ceratodon purpureus]
MAKLWGWALSVTSLLLVVRAVMAGMGNNAPGLPSCNCEEDWGLLELVTRCQLASDFLIALAYFSIPLELVYFVSFSNVFPFRWIIIQFGAFIVLCGLTHFISIWTYGPHSFLIMLAQTILKIATALVSCATAITLVHVIPTLLHVKVRELFLKHKAAELDREMGIIKDQEEAGRHVRMLTNEIRSTLDRHTILNTTLVELVKTLELANCTIWEPNAEGDALKLTHELDRRFLQVPVTIPASDKTVQQIIQTSEATVISPVCALGKASNHRGLAGAMAAVRLPLLCVSNFKGGTPEVVSASYAILVLMLPGETGRVWTAHEIDLVEVVADQVAVALSHAAVLEDSHRTRDALVEQNKSLQLARQEAETAIRARNDFLAVMNHEMRTPMHAIIALSSLLQEGKLSLDQRSMVDTVVKSSSLLSTLINDVLDFSRLEDGSLSLEMRPFELPTVLREAENLAKPMAKGKGLDFYFDINMDVPQFVIGDEKRLLQITLNIIGNAVKFTRHGFVSVSVSLEKYDANIRRDPRNPSWRPIPVDGFAYIRIVVKDTGLGVRDSDIPRLFNKFVQADSTTTRQYGGTGLGLAICKKFVQLMNGHIWIESEGLNRGSVVTFLVRLQLQSDSSKERERPSREEELNKEDLNGLKVLVTDDNSVNRIVTRRLLDRLGCDTTVVESGQQCLAALSQPGSNFKVLLLDLCMPEMDGYDVAKIIKQKFRPGEPLVVALTANTDKGTKERCLQIGMDDIVLKPISLQEMSSVLCNLLHHPKSGTRSQGYPNGR